MSVLLYVLIATSPVENLTAKVRGSIEATLVEATQNTKTGAALAAQVARLLRWEGDVVRNVHPNDAIRVVFDHDGEGEPQLLAINYDGAEIDVEAYRFEVDGIPRYFDAHGKLLEPWLKRNPVPQYVQITETVQHGRGKRRHRGLDLKAPEGTPIAVPKTAKVRRVNWRTRANGNCVEVVYKDGTYARFLHLKDIAKHVRPGRTLTAGTSIGTVGSTGRSGAPHLHYELSSKRGVLSPLKYHGTETYVLPKALKPEFESHCKALSRELQTATSSERS